MYNEIEFKAKIIECVISKMEDIINNQCKDYGVININTQIECIGDYIFAVCHTEVKTSSTMNRYNMFCYSSFGIELHYSDNNVIDKGKQYTIKDVVTRAKNYFAHHSNKLNSL